MKDYKRENPLFSLCGLNCGLCPMHINGYCPGCGGGAGHQPCGIVRCARLKDGVEYCFQCTGFPCQRYDGAAGFDSFITHKNMVSDLKRAQEAGIAAYQAEQDEKIGILQELLEHYNDGRKKSFFCLAVNLLNLADIREVMRRLKTQTAPGAPAKEKAALAAALFQSAAGERGMELKLRKKPKKE